MKVSLRILERDRQPPDGEAPTCPLKTVVAQLRSMRTGGDGPCKAVVPVTDRTIYPGNHFTIQSIQAT